jgi:hypothetical protein
MPNARTPLWRRPWFIVTVAVVALLVLITALAGDRDKPTDRTTTAGTTPAPTPTPTPTADPAVAARAEAATLAGDSRYADAVTVLEAAGLHGAADRVARRGSQALARRARQALDAGHWTQARSVAADARDLHGSKTANAIIASASTKIAEARAAARLARDLRTCSAGEKDTVRAGGGVPSGCAEFAANLAARRAADAAQAAAAQCDSSYAGACLKPDSPDYDCEGGSGDGPDYTGTVQVVGDDHYDLDRDGDGIACDP